MSQVTGKKVAVTPMPTPTGTSGAIIDSFNTQDDQTVNAPSIHIVKDALTTINDNLAQTPITVGGETLSTIDDKLNYLLANKIAINDLLKLVEDYSRSGTLNGTYTPDFNGKILGVLAVLSRYGRTASISVNGNTVTPLIVSDNGGSRMTDESAYTYINFYIYAFDVNVGDTVAYSENVNGTSSQHSMGTWACLYKLQ